MNRRTLVFNYYGMTNVGGIEKYINEVTGSLLGTDVRIIWLKEKNSKVAQSFQEHMLDPRVETVEITQRGYHWFSIGNLCFMPDEEITIVSFSPLDMGRAMYIANKYKHHAINLLYAIPNTTGNMYFLERYFKGTLRNTVAKRMGRIFEKWEQAGALLFFSAGQIKPLEDAYDLEITSKQEKLLPGVKPLPVLNEDKLIERSKRDPFKIITVGRFEFPHKGYMLGLIDAYDKLKATYPNIKLDIIGFGPDEILVRNRIEKLSDQAKADIRLLGEVAPDNLPQYFESASLNISVAGGVNAGVKLGVFSIPARNYCYGECEVYGFLPEKKSMTVSTSPGEPVEDYIIRVIEMSDEEYVNRCRLAYDDLKANFSYNPTFFLEKGCEAKTVANSSDIAFLRLLHYMTKITDYVGIAKTKWKGLFR